MESSYSIFPNWKYFASGFALVVSSYIFNLLPKNASAQPQFAEILVQALATLTFYIGLAVLIIFLLSFCIRLIFAGIAPSSNAISFARINFKWNWAMTGFLILFFQFCIEQLPFPQDLAGDNNAKNIVSGITTPMFYVGLALISASIIFTNIQEKIITFWREEVLTKLRENIDEVSYKYISAVRAETLQEAIKQAGEQDVSDNLNYFVSKVYGDHCTKDKGLFQTLKSRLFCYLNTSTVHRSNYIKKITIDEANGKNKWDETCEFQLHCIKLDSDYGNVTEGDEIEYELKYNPSMGIQGRPENIQEFWDLEIRIFSNDNEQGEVIFDSKQALELNAEKDGINVIKNFEADIELDYDLDAKDFSFKFRKVIKLKKAFTKVVLKETSHLPENYFTLSTKEPSCGMDIDIHLPSGWIFEDHNVFNPDKSWSISTHPSNRLSLNNSGWVLPGIVMNCIWKSNK